MIRSRYSSRSFPDQHAGPGVNRMARAGCRVGATAARRGQPDGASGARERVARRWRGVAWRVAWHQRLHASKSRHCFNTAAPHQGWLAQRARARLSATYQQKRSAIGQLVRRLTLHREVRGSNPCGDKIRTAAFRGSDLLGLEKYLKIFGNHLSPTGTGLGH